MYLVIKRLDVLVGGCLQHEIYHWGVGGGGDASLMDTN